MITITHSSSVNNVFDEEAMKEYSLYPGVLTKGRKKDKVLSYLQYQIDTTTDKEWKMLWGLLQIMIESNGVINSERSKQTTSRICQLLVLNSENIDDLPPNELDNPNPATYISDLISIQEMLLSGKVHMLVIV